MHWIQLDPTQGTCTRGKTKPPEGDVYFVTPTGAHALLGGVLWKDGKHAPKGTHTLTFDDGSTLPIVVATAGKAAQRGALKGPPAKGATP